MSLARPRFRFIALCLAGLSFASLAGAQDQPNMTPEAAEAHAAKVRVSRSAREAGPSLVALKLGGTPGLKQLGLLLDSDVLAPEVRYQVLMGALNSDAPGAADIAVRYVSDSDLDVRIAALFQMGNHAEAKHRDRLLAAAKTEKNDDAMLLLLSALGRVGDRTTVLPFLESFLMKGGNQNLIHGAAYGLGAMQAGEKSAAKILDVIDEKYPRDWRESLLSFAHKALGAPEDDARIVAAASTPNPLRLWAIDRLTWFMGGAKLDEPKSPAARKAAISALTDKNPVIRHRALLAVEATHRAYYAFLTDEAPVRTLAGLKSDPSPLVRLGVIEALHQTCMRRGLMAPGTNPLKLEGPAMRMLRFPPDWITFPTLIGLLDDPADEVNEKAAWMLGISTGYWYGYEDIRLLGKPQLTTQVKNQYKEMWDAMKDKTPETMTREIMDDVVKRLEHGDGEEAHQQWFVGVRLLTGRDFGWRPDADTAAKKKAIHDLSAWWVANKAKTPALWIIDSVRAEGFNTVDDFNFSILARSGLGNPPRNLFDRKTRNENPDLILANLEAWWNASGKH